MISAKDCRIDDVSQDWSWKYFSKIISIPSDCKSLDLSYSGIGSEVNKEFLKLLEKNPKFIRILPAQLAAALNKNKTLTSLDLSNNSMVDDDVKKLAEALNKNKALTKINLSGNNIGNTGVKYLKESLAVNNTLEDINLGQNSIDISSIAELCNGSMLKVLRLPFSELKNEGVRQLADALSGNKTLIELDLVANNITYDGVKALAERLPNMEQLTSVILDINEVSAKGAMELIQLNKLTKLSVRNASIGLDGMQDLAKVLNEDETLLDLKLGVNSMGVEAATILVDALKDNKVLKKLYLDANKLGEEWAKMLAERFNQPNQWQLDELILANNNIKKGAVALANALEDNTTLNTLGLTGNAIQDDGAKALAELLKSNYTLSQLVLNNNEISDTGVGYLANALTSNKGLKILSLVWNNKISSNGIEKLAVALQHNDSLEELNLFFAPDGGKKPGSEFFDTLPRVINKKLKIK
ncbi:MAG: hypothetical protein ACON5A_01640 [Candidatus Comchoanobacterales bacterium]